MLKKGVVLYLSIFLTFLMFIQLGVALNDSVQIHSVDVAGNYIKIVYSKNFDTCAHIYLSNNSNTAFNQKINFICTKGDNQVAIANMGSFERYLHVGEKIKICHANNRNVCSQVISINQSQAVCTDSDNGMNYSVFGKTSFNFGGNLSDVCQDSNILIESYCVSSKGPMNSMRYACPNGCLNGACLNSTTPKINCTDTDGGINYNVSGNATGYNSDFSQRTTVSDRCIDSIRLYESYCASDNRLNGIYFNCSFGCKNGACVSQVIPENKTITCTDSDGGINYDVYGSCSRMVLSSSSGSGLGSYDECKNAITLKECYCDLNKSIAISNFNCPYGCENGKCKEQVLNPEDYFSYNLSARVTRDSDTARTNRTTIRDIVTRQDICVDLREGDICTVGNLVIQVKKVNYISVAQRSAEFEIISDGSFWKKILINGFNIIEEIINSKTIFVNASSGIEKYFVVVDYLQEKDKIVAYYKFDNDFKDLIGNYNGEGFNVEFKEGINSSAASFNGINSYIKVNDLYSKKDKYSFSMWINPSSFSNRSLFFHFGGSEGNHYAELRKDGRILFVHGNSPYTYIISNSKVNFNEWNYVAVTWDAEKMQIYINGKLDSARSSGNSSVVKSGYTMIGKSAIFYYNGLIDELKIWNYDLSEDEVKEDYGVNARELKMIVKGPETDNLINIKKILLNISTNKDAECEYKLYSSIFSFFSGKAIFSSMNKMEVTGGIEHLQEISDLQERDYILRLKCISGEEIAEEEIDFSVDFSTFIYVATKEDQYKPGDIIKLSGKN